MNSSITEEDWKSAMLQYDHEVGAQSEKLLSVVDQFLRDYGPGAVDSVDGLSGAVSPDILAASDNP